MIIFMHRCIHKTVEIVIYWHCKMISNQRQTNQKLNAQSLILFCLEKDWVAIISNNAGIFHHNLSGNIQPSQLSLLKL